MCIGFIWNDIYKYPRKSTLNNPLRLDQSVKVEEGEKSTVRLL